MARTLGSYLRTLRARKERELRRDGALRAGERLSQERVARALGCALATYHRYEHDLLRGLVVLEKIAAYYGVPLETLVRLPGRRDGR
jgi:transcriptional regulator with XRE-family HTH domain